MKIYTTPIHKYHTQNKKGMYFQPKIKSKKINGLMIGKPLKT